MEEGMTDFQFKKLLEMILMILEGSETKEEAIEKVKQNSRNYAKRQITYFKGMRIVDKQYVKFNDFAAIFNTFRLI